MAGLSNGVNQSNNAEIITKGVPNTYKALTGFRTVAPCYQSVLGSCFGFGVRHRKYGIFASPDSNLLLMPKFVSSLFQEA
jgi:hypothetical protein